MIGQAGIANLNNSLLNQVAKKEAHAQAPSKFMETFKNYMPRQVAILNDKAAAELNFSKWKFEDLWAEDPDEKLHEDPYDEIVRIFRKFLKKK
ncbi:MAG: hypothetical protein V3T21_02040 [Candidatus Margulisiibacteriota bacterium]